MLVSQARLLMPAVSGHHPIYAQFIPALLSTLVARELEIHSYANQPTSSSKIQ